MSRSPPKVLPSDGLLTNPRVDGSFCALADALPALIFLADAEGRCSFTNRGFQEYTGLVADTVKGDGWLHALHPDDFSAVKEAWKSAVAVVEPFEIELRLRASDGHHCWYLMRAVPVRSNGHVDHWVGTCTDIDDRMRIADNASVEHAHTRSALDDSQARYRTVFQSMFSFVGLLSLDGILVEANDAALSFGGVTAEEVVGRHLWDTPWWDVGEEAKERLRRAVAAAADGEFVHYEAEVRVAGGGIAPVDFSLKPVFDAEGRVRQIIPEGRDLSRTKSVERALRESEARYRSIFENAAVGIACIDLRTERWLTVNETLCRLVGYSEDELLARQWTATTHPDDVELASLQRMASGALRSFAVEKRYVHKAGHAVWARVTVSAVDTSKAMPGTAIAVIEDIGERKAQEAAASAEATNKAFLLAFADRVRPIGDARTVMAVATEMLGLHLGATQVGYGEVSGLDAACLVDQEWRCDDAPSLIGTWRLDDFGVDLIDTLRQGGTVPIADVSRDPRTRDPRTVAAFNAISVRALLNVPLIKDGRLCAIFFVHSRVPRRWTKAEAALVAEICERTWAAIEKVRAEAALSASEARLQRIVRSGIVGVGFGDTSGTVHEVNDAFLAIIGRSRAELSTEAIDWRRLTAPEYAERDAAAVAELLRDGVCLPYEKEYVVGDRRVPVQIAMAAIDPERNRSEHVALIVDLSAQKAAQAALAESHAQLEGRVAERTVELSRANERLLVEMKRRAAAQAALLQSQKLEALGHLTSSVAHDFNNVLAAVIGGFGLIAKRATDERQVRVATEGTKAAERGAALIRQLLAFARQQTVVAGRVDLHRLFEELAPHLRHVTGDTVRLVLDLEHGLPPVQIDPSQLHAALTNLAVNARDAMASGGTLTMHVQSVPLDAEQRPAELAGGAAVAIRVVDTGAGMDPLVLQRVLEPFFTTKPPGKGTGLGLAMVQGLMLQSGGALRITSRIGQGTEIVLYIPTASATDSQSDGDEAEARADERIHRGGRVLLVEDDELVRAVVAEQLSELGYVVAEVREARSALAVLEDGQRLDFVITDYLLSGNDGVKLVAEIRRTRASLPVLFITGQGHPEGLEGERVLNKPFIGEDLSEALLDMTEQAEVLAEADAALDRLQARIEGLHLKSCLQAWRRARRNGLLPTRNDFKIEPADRDWVVEIKVDQTRVPMTFWLGELGAALHHRVPGQPWHSALDVVGNESEDTLEGAYRRCVRSGKPTYEFARHGFGDRHHRVFERLLLPCRSGGNTIDILVAVVRFAETDGSPYPVEGTNGLVTFDMPGLARAVEALAPHAVDALPFGAIRLDEDGRVVTFNQTERNRGGSGTLSRLGRDFFTEIAPCMDTPEFRGRVERARASGTLDLAFTHIGDFADRERELTVRVQSASGGGTWIFQRRED